MWCIIIIIIIIMQLILLQNGWAYRWWGKSKKCPRFNPRRSACHSGHIIVFACSLVSLVSLASHGANCYCSNNDPWGKGGATMEEVQVYIGKETVLKSSSAIIYGITFMHASWRIVDSQLFRLWPLDNYWVSYGFKSDFLENCNSWYVI